MVTYFNSISINLSVSSSFSLRMWFGLFSGHTNCNMQLMNEIWLELFQKLFSKVGQLLVHSIGFQNISACNVTSFKLNFYTRRL